MSARLGMFPYVMLATTPLFFAYDWPRRAINYIICSKRRGSSTSPSDTAAVAAAADDEDAGDDDDNDDNVSLNSSATNKAGKVCRLNDVE